MIGALIALLITILVLGVVWWAIQQLLPLIPIAEPFATIVRVILILILVLVVIYVLLRLLAVAGVHVPVFL